MTAAQTSWEQRFGGQNISYFNRTGKRCWQIIHHHIKVSSEHTLLCKAKRILHPSRVSLSPFPSYLSSWSWDLQHPAGNGNSLAAAGLHPNLSLLTSFSLDQYLMSFLTAITFCGECFFTPLLTTMHGLGSGGLPGFFFPPVLLHVKAAFERALFGLSDFFSDLTGDVKMKPWGGGVQVQILFLALNGLLKW